MLFSEFQKLTGLTDKAISYEMYSEIEKAYESIPDDKEKFCKNFYKMYRKIVSPEIEKIISSATLEEKLQLIEEMQEGLPNELEARADKAREAKTWQLINWYQVQSIIKKSA